MELTLYYPTIINVILMHILITQPSTYLATGLIFTLNPPLGLAVIPP